MLTEDMSYFRYFNVFTLDLFHNGIYVGKECRKLFTFIEWNHETNFFLTIEIKTDDDDDKPVSVEHYIIKVIQPSSKI